MNYLKTNGFRVITPEDLLAFLEYRAPLPKKAVMITIDDGYRSVYDVAYPILKKYGFTATVFVYTNYVGISHKAITWNQLRDMKANGFTIGSHTIAHSDLTKQSEDEDVAAYLDRLRREITRSKYIIDRKLNQDTMFFSYPFGRANGTAIKMCHDAGYRLAVTVNRGGNPFFANPFMLRRDQVLKRDMATFIKRLKTFHSITLR
jgi:peptidoglycan/xylan/chitin deacetylase (PgdA/CDA1 family)